jgi:hypothetical protein
MDWIKALLIGVALLIGLLAIPILLAIVIPLGAFVIVIGVIWFLLQILKDDDPKKPP